MDRFDDVQDPSDFPIVTLRKLDSSLRCPICKELFDGPVILQCGHSFCSLCVRNLLPTKPECPKCRAPAKEMHLIRNATFEEAVTAWSDARGNALRLAKESVRFISSPSSTFDALSGTKRELPQEASGAEAGPSKRIRHESYKNRIIPPEKEEGNDEECSDVYVEDATVQATPPVPCPLCARYVTYDLINQHIDSDCKKFVINAADSSARKESDSKSKAAWDTIFDGQGKSTGRASSAKDSEISVKRLAKVSYRTLKNHHLRKLLEDNGLPTTGERQELILRHQRWIAINNANLDRGQPKPVRDLKRQLKEIEDVASRPGPKKVQDEKEYARKNGAHFASLIEKARPKVEIMGKPMSATESSVLPQTSTGLSPSSPAPTTSEVIQIDG